MKKLSFSILFFVYIADILCQNTEKIKEFDYIQNDGKNHSIVIVNGKYGVIGYDSSFLVPPKYDFIDEIYNGYLRTKLDNKWGAIDLQGNEKIPFIYEEISNYNRSSFSVKLNGKYGVIDIFKNVIVPIEMEQHIHFDDDKAIVKKNGKYGIVNNKGEIIVPTENIEISMGEFDGYHVKKNMFKTYHIPYESVESLRKKDSLMKVKPKHKKINLYNIGYLYGYKNENDSIVIPAIYYNAKNFSEGLAYVRNHNTNGFIDSTGKIILSINRKYTANEFHKGVCKIYNRIVYNRSGIEISDNEKWGYINNNGQFARPSFYDRNGKEIFNDTKSGFINAKGEVMVPAIYDKIEQLKSNKYIVLNEKSFIILDSNGREINHYPFEEIYPSYEGKYKKNWYEIIQRNSEYLFFYKNKMGFINEYGHEITNMKYDFVERYDYKLEYLKVRIGDKYGIIDTSGKLMITIDYDSIKYSPRNNQQYLSIKNGKFGLFDKNLNSIIPNDYENIEFEYEGLIAAKKDGKWGFINPRNEIVIPFIYEKVSNFKENESEVILDKKSFKINRLNKLINN